MITDRIYRKGIKRDMDQIEHKAMQEIENNILSIKQCLDIINRSQLLMND